MAKTKRRFACQYAMVGGCKKRATHRLEIRCDGARLSARVCDLHRMDLKSWAKKHGYTVCDT